MWGIIIIGRNAHYSRCSIFPGKHIGNVTTLQRIGSSFRTVSNRRGEAGEFCSTEIQLTITGMREERRKLTKLRMERFIKQAAKEERNLEALSPAPLQYKIQEALELLVAEEGAMGGSLSSSICAHTGRILSVIHDT